MRLWPRCALSPLVPYILLMCRARLLILLLSVGTSQSRLTDSSADATRFKTLERDLKEKNVLIGKLRHESLFLTSSLASLPLLISLCTVLAVIMNEHLTEALRRLRRNSSETTVDRCVFFLFCPFVTFYLALISVPASSPADL